MPAARRFRRFGRLWLWPLLLLALLLSVYALPWRDAVEPTRAWIAGFGLMGWAVYLALYVAVVMLPLPAAAMSIVGGLLFGWWGLPLAMAGSVLGALPPFWLTQRWLRGPALRRFDGPRVAAADVLVRRHAWVFVTLLRITPILPYTVQNYLLGLTSVATGPYVGATVLGLAPSTVALVWVGTLGGLDVAEMGREQALISVGGLIAFALLLLWMTREATRRLRQSGFDGRITGAGKDAVDEDGD